MPCLLKQKTSGSPGIISFTHNEVLNGVLSHSALVRDYVSRTAQEGHWLYGVHIQGDCTHLGAWPLASWQSFLMWADLNARFLSEVPRADLTPITCVNFLPLPSQEPIVKAWDICIISRPSEIKKITETLLIIQALLKLKPDLSVIFVVPDPRDQSLGDKAYREQGIERNFFELPRNIFTCEQLKRLSFISSSQLAFGTFPLADDLIADIIARSRFLLLNSRREGVPRVIAEALTHGTPCIVSTQLVSGLNGYLNEANTLFIEPDVETAAQQIADALDGYARFRIDRQAMQQLFCDVHHKPALREFLSEKMRIRGLAVQGDWYLEELDLRLACHGRKHNMQFMNDERLFFDWIHKVEHCVGEPTEDYLFGNEPLVDRKRLSLAETRKYLKVHLWQPVRRQLGSLVRALT